MRKLMLFFIILLLAAGCVAAPEKGPESGAPAFSYEDLQGKMWSLPELRGKVVALYFWTGSCGVCVAKLPELPTLEKQLPEDVYLLLLNADDSRERIEELIGDAPLTVLMNTMNSFRDYKVAYVPTTVFINREGEVASVQVGFITNEKTMEIIESLR